MRSSRPPVVSFQSSAVICNVYTLKSQTDTNILSSAPGFHTAPAQASGNSLGGVDGQPDHTRT